MRARHSSAVPTMTMAWIRRSVTARAAACFVAAVEGGGDGAGLFLEAEVFEVAGVEREAHAARKDLLEHALGALVVVGDGDTHVAGHIAGAGLAPRRGLALADPGPPPPRRTPWARS